MTPKYSRLTPIALFVLAVLAIAAAVAVVWRRHDERASTVAQSRADRPQQAAPHHALATDPLPAADLPPASGPIGPAPSVQAPKAVKAIPQPSLDTPAATLYARIAATGASPANAADVVKLARTADRCWFVMTYERIAEAIPASDDPQMHAAAQRIARAERDSARELCADLPPDAFDRVDRWIAELAAQGDPASMFAYGAQAFWVRDPINALRDPARLMEFRKNTLSYLDALITQGYPAALVAMASIKLNPAWGEPDQTAAWAYMYAAAKAQGDTAREANLLQSLNDRVAANEQAGAQALAKDLLRRCCER
jgi:hypothetical protein